MRGRLTASSGERETGVLATPSGLDRVMLLGARVALLAALVTLPLTWGAPMNLALGLALALTLALLARGAIRACAPLVAWLLLGLTGAAAISALTGLDPWCGFQGPAALAAGVLGGRSPSLWCGFRGWLDVVRGTLLFVLALHLLGERRAREAWLGAITATAVFLTLWGLVDFLLGHRTGQYFLRDPAIGHSNHTASFLVITLPAVALSAARRRAGAAVRWAGAVAVVLGGVALVLTQSLTGWIAAAVVLALALALRPRFGLAATGAAVVAAAIMAVPAWAKLNTQWLEMSIGLRLTWWSGALRVIADYPLFGIGPRNFILIDPARYGFKPSFHAHNLYVNVATELGLVGLVLFLAILAALACRLRETRGLIAGEMDRVCWYSAAAALAAIAVLGLATTPYHSRIAMMFWAIMGLFHAQFADRPPDPASRP